MNERDASNMVLKIIMEGLALGGILVMFCAVGIRNGAVNLVHLYHLDVQEYSICSGLITKEKMKRNEKLFRLVGIATYMAFTLVCVYAINGTRGFRQGFWQIFAILSVVNLVDRLLIDEYWVGHTKAWEIPGTENMKPYINWKDKIRKWLMGTVGFAAIAAFLSGIMSLIGFAE